MCPYATLHALGTADKIFRPGGRAVLNCIGGVYLEIWRVLALVSRLEKFFGDLPKKVLTFLGLYDIRYPKTGGSWLRRGRLWA